MEIPSQVNHNSSGCFGGINSKIFEIILIIGFILALAGVTNNLVLTMYMFFYSYAIFFIEIALIALNLLCLIFSILLRVWRSNGSVLNMHLNSSSKVSLFILIFSIINLIGSIVEDVFLFLIMDYILYNLGKFDKINDYKDYEKKEKIFNKLFRYKKDEDEEKFLFIKDDKVFLKIIEILPWLSMNFNAFVQILMIIFIIIIRIRIRANPMIAPQQSYSQNRMNNPNSEEVNNISEAKTATTKKRTKNKKGGKYDNGGINSEMVDIMDNTKNTKKKKSKKKKKKNKKVKEQNKKP